MQYPIGILTHNRAIYLDATLRSLAATDLPAGTAPVVYDDGSDDPLARWYLDQGEAAQAAHRWPTWPEWRAAGLGVLEDNPTLRGLAGRIEVVRLAPPGRPLGVVSASAAAVRDLFRRAVDGDDRTSTPAVCSADIAAGGEPAGVILLQDDILFRRDWYAALAAELAACRAAGRRVGLIAGFHLDGQDFHHRGLRREATCSTRFASAQCYLVTRELLTASAAWFQRDDLPRESFDRQLCDLTIAAGMEIRLVVPYVCQHIGLASEVRPHVPFRRGDARRPAVPVAPSRIRLGHHAAGPWAMDMYIGEEPG